MLKTTKLVIVAASISLLCNCKGKDGATGPAGADGTNTSSNTKGTTIGTINLRDELDSEFTSDKSGVKLTLVGSNPEITVVTDTKGNYAFENVKTGNYDLLIKKEGFPDYNYEGFIIFEGPKPIKNYGFTLRQTSTTVLSNLVVSTEEPDFGGKVLKFKVKVMPTSDQGNGRTVLFVFSNNPNVSINDLGVDYYSSSATTSVSYTSAVGDSAVMRFTKYNDVYTGNNGSTSIIESGRKVYCKAYAIAKNDSYTTLGDSKRLYPTLSSSSSNVASAIAK
jgi:hypothetical protein